MHSAVELSVQSQRQFPGRGIHKYKTLGWERAKDIWMRRKAHSSRWYSWRGVESVDHGRTIRHGRIFELSYLHYILAFFHRALSIFRDHRLYPFCSQIVVGSLIEVMILMSLIAQLKNIEKWCINLVRLHFYLLTVLLLKWLQPERISPYICLPW